MALTQRRATVYRKIDSFTIQADARAHLLLQNHSSRIAIETFRPGNNQVFTIPPPRTYRSQDDIYDGIVFCYVDGRGGLVAAVHKNQLIVVQVLLLLQLPESCRI